MGDRTYSFDAGTLLSDGAAAYTATGFAQVGGADGIVDLGGNQGVTITLPSIADVSTITPQQARIDAVCVIDVSALDAVTTDESYRLILCVSNDPGFAAGKIFVAGELELAGGVLSVLGPGGAGVTGTSTAGRYEMPFCNEQNNVKYEYAKLFNVLSGTTPSITYKAFIAVLPEP